MSAENREDGGVIPKTRTILIFMIVWGLLLASVNLSQGKAKTLFVGFKHGEKSNSVPEGWEVITYFRAVKNRLSLSKEGKRTVLKVKSGSGLWQGGGEGGKKHLSHALQELVFLAGHGHEGSFIHHGIHGFEVVGVAMGANHQADIVQGETVLLHGHGQGIEAGFPQLVAEMPRVDQHMGFLSFQGVAQEAAVAVVAPAPPGIKIEILG